MNFEISVYDGIQFDEGEMKPIRVAEMRVKADGKKRSSAWIKVVGDDDVTLFDSMALWARRGCPSAKFLKSAEVTE